MSDAVDGQGAASDDLSNAQAIEHLKSSLAQGKDWIRSLLESMATVDTAGGDLPEATQQVPPGRGGLRLAASG